MLAEKWVNNVIFVKRYDHRWLQLHFLVGTSILNFICCYAAQSGGDFNGYVGEHCGGFEVCHGGCGYGVRNKSGWAVHSRFLCSQQACNYQHFLSQEEKHVYYLFIWS